MRYKCFDQKTRSGAFINERLAEELHKPVNKISKEANFTRDLKKKFGQQAQLKWNHFL